MTIASATLSRAMDTGTSLLGTVLCLAVKLILREKTVTVEINYN